MSRKITIDPVTRVEGHGRVTIHRMNTGKYRTLFPHCGVSRFRTIYSGASVLGSTRIGSTTVRHLSGESPPCRRQGHRSTGGIDPRDWPAATKLRRLLHYGQIFQSHALHFFYLASPDLLFGMDAPIENETSWPWPLRIKKLGTQRNSDAEIWSGNHQSYCRKTNPWRCCRSGWHAQNT